MTDKSKMDKLRQELRLELFNDPRVRIGADVLMDYVLTLPTVEDQVKALREATYNPATLRALSGNQRFTEWLLEHKNLLVAKAGTWPPVS